MNVEMIEFFAIITNYSLEYILSFQKCLAILISFLERNLALQAPILHATAASTSGVNSTIQGQYVNSLCQNRNESINSPTNSNHTTTTTLTPLVNAKIHPHPQLSQHDPSQYTTIATIQQQQPNQLQPGTQQTHVQYPQAIQAVLHQVTIYIFQN